MAANTNSESETHSIEANDNLVKSVIVDQTDNIEKGWREFFQNIIDSGATEGRLEQTHEYTFVADNGSGVDLKEQDGIDLLTVMGETTKDAEDHSTIGEFGVGVGQGISKGVAFAVSGYNTLIFDIKGWGLEAKMVPLSSLTSFVYEEFESDLAKFVDERFGHVNHYDGLAWLVYHYDDEVPDENSYKWSKFRNNIQERFQYLNAVRDTELYLNDEVITDSDALDINSHGHPTYNKVYDSPETGKVHIAVKHGYGSLTVYSGGIKVTDVDSRGIEGRIITDRNLRLNFARNEIKSGCPIWSEIEDLLNDIREDLLTEEEESLELENEARDFLADQMFNHGKMEIHADKDIFETASEDMVSWNEIIKRDEIGTARKGNRAADKLEEAYGEIVLNENDDAVETFLENREDIPEAPSDFDAVDRAETRGLHTSYEKIDESGLKPTQWYQLGIARYIVHLMDDDLDVRYGESDVASAWTDGSSEIVITDTATSSSKWISWVPELWNTMMHELAHNTPSKDEPGHGVGYRRRFRQNIERDGGIEALSDLMGEINEKTLSTVAETGHSVYMSD